MERSGKEQKMEVSDGKNSRLFEGRREADGQGLRAALTENTSCIGCIGYYLIGEQKRICMDTGTIVVFDKPGKRARYGVSACLCWRYVNIVHGFVKGQ